MNRMDDFAKHLRAVHFTLFLACAGIFLTSGLISRSPIDQAYQDIRNIERLLSSLEAQADESEAVQDWIRHVAMESSAFGDPSEDETIRPVRVYGTSGAGDGSLSPMIFIIDVNDLALLHEPSLTCDEGRALNLDSDYRLRYFDDFVCLWDAIDDDETFYLPRQIDDTLAVYIEPDSDLASSDSPDAADTVVLDGALYRQFARATLWGSGSDLGTALADAAEGQPELFDSIDLDDLRKDIFPHYSANRQPVDFQLADETDGQIAGSMEQGPRLAQIVGLYERSRILVLGANLETETEDVRIPASIQAELVTFDLRNELRQRGDSNWTDANFSTAFPELNDVGSEYAGFSPEQLLRVLESEAARIEASLEVAGVNLPGESLLSYGGLFLVGIQIYFLSHLKRFSVRVKSKEDLPDIPWIGLYPGPFSRFWYCVSALLLPIFTSGFLAFILFDNNNRFLDDGIAISWNWLTNLRVDEVLSILSIAFSVVAAIATFITIRSIWKRGEILAVGDR